ncbi:DNA alkylation repair protein [Leptospira sp. WS92.C1]
MDQITSKKEIKNRIETIIKDQNDKTVFIQRINSEILQKKVKFPLLEYAAQEIQSKISETKQIEFTNQIIDLRQMGGYVIAGMILQLRSDKHLDESLGKAVEYMILGNEWYVCDIIGERVMGYSLLKNPKHTIPILKTFIFYDNSWVTRSVGVATHYAVKKGLRKKYVEEMFRLLLTQSGTKDFHTKKGIGWAVKTIAKFHPDIIQKFDHTLTNDSDINPFFKTKIRIGLSRSSKYASKYSD